MPASTAPQCAAASCAGATRPSSATSKRPTEDQLSLLPVPTLKQLTVAPVIDAPCDYCLQHSTAQCPACAMRRRKAVRLAEREGLDAVQIASRMRLTVPRVQRLLEQEADRRELRALAADEIPVSRVLELLNRRRRRDPDFTVADLMRLAGYTSQTHVERLLGLKPTSDTRKNGKTYPGRIVQTVAVEHASRLVRALGYAPCEVEGL